MTESLIDLGLAIACETCESEIEFNAASQSDAADGICRQCGLAYRLDSIRDTHSATA